MKLLLLAVLVAVPLVSVHAVDVAKPTDFKSLLANFTGIINLLIPFLFALTFLTITWGVIKAWVMGDASEDDVEKGKKVAFVGVIVLVVMSGIWGILALLQEGIFG